MGANEQAFRHTDHLLLAPVDSALSRGQRTSNSTQMGAPLISFQAREDLYEQVPGLTTGTFKVSRGLGVGGSLERCWSASRWVWGEGAQAFQTTGAWADSALA